MIQKKIRCLVVDDEPLAVDILKTYINSTPLLELAGTCNHALSAYEYLQRDVVDLMFVDVQMPILTGTEFIKSLQNPPYVIFTSAHREFALDGFDLGAVDYLLKPVSFDRFLKSVNKLTKPGQATAAEDSDHSSERFLYFRVDRKMTKVILSEIEYIESLKDYVKIVTTRGQITTKQSISALEQMLPETEFLRIHRSFIVSVKKIDSYTASDITMGKTELPIGPLYRYAVTNRLSS